MSDTTFLILAGLLVLAMAATLFALTRSTPPAPPLRFGQPATFHGPDGQPIRIVATEVTWADGETHVHFQDEASLKRKYQIR